MLEALYLDVRHAGRALWRSPGFTAPIVITTALVVAMTTAVFSVVYGVLLRPLPFPNGDRVVQVRGLSPSRDSATPYRSGLSASHVRSWRERSRTTTDIALYSPATKTLTGTSRAIQLHGAEVSASLFAVLGTSALIGRTFTSVDERLGAEPVVILAHRTWLTYGGVPAGLSGLSLALDGKRYRAIGVMRPDFTFPSLATGDVHTTSDGRLVDSPDFWLPIIDVDTSITQLRPAIALLRRGAQLSQAVAEASAILAPSHTIDVPPAGFRFAEVVTLRGALGSRVRPALLTFQAGVLLVLLIACVNALNLWLTRASHHQAEHQIRVALGATRWQMVRHAMSYWGCAGALSAASLLTSWWRVFDNCLPRCFRVCPRSTLTALSSRLHWRYPSG